VTAAVGVTSAAASSGVRLFTDRTSPFPPMVCLDANAVFDIWEHELAMSGRPKKRKHSDLVTCLSRMRAARTQLFVTPHVVEEFFHVTTQSIMRPLYDKHSVRNEKALRKMDPAGHGKGRAEGLKALEEALGALGKHGVIMLLPVGEEPPSPASLGKEALDAFKAFLYACADLGGKDAIHLSVAGLLDCTAFISRDGDFHCVRDVVVYSDRLPSAAALPVAAPAPAHAPSTSPSIYGATPTKVTK